MMKARLCRAVLLQALPGVRAAARRRGERGARQAGGAGVCGEHRHGLIP